MPVTISNPVRAAVAFALALAASGAAAQKYTPPEPPPLTTAPCKPTKKDPCTPPAAPAASPAANAFPFPGESDQDAQDKGKIQTAPPAATGNPLASPGENPFPFPGEPPETPAASSFSSSSSSSTDADPDQPALKDEGSGGSTRFARKKLAKVAIVDNDEREAKDLEVSKYYYSTGNFAAAYLRAKDAATTLPDDPAAHLALASAAARLNKVDEASTEYNACLKLDVSDEQRKAVKKGLAELAEVKAPKQAKR